MQSLEIFQWCASISGTIAAIMVASRLSNRVTGLGFAIFTVSSILWVTAGLWDATYSLAMQNSVLTAVNLFGVYRWLIAPPRPERAAPERPGKARPGPARAGPALPAPARPAPAARRGPLPSSQA